MHHNDDAFTAMLLTLPLTADKEELVRPLASVEFLQLVKRVEEAGLGSIGSLIGMDISAVMSKMDMPEQEAYRICMLLSRTMPLSYAMERFMDQNIEILTGMDEEYPERLNQKLGTDAPMAMYVSGNLGLLKQPMVALLGISGVKMTPASEKGVRMLVRSLKDEGFGLITSSEPGACRVAEKEAFECGVNVISVLAGELSSKKEEDMYIEAQMRDQALLVSLVHPDAPYTGVHALMRNRVVYAMALASFIATTDAKRGETEALRKKLCDWMYAFDTPTPLGNRIVISRGITPVPDFEIMDFAKYAQNWRMANAQQLSFL